MSGLGVSQKEEMCEEIPVATTILDMICYHTCYSDEGKRIPFTTTIFANMINYYSCYQEEIGERIPFMTIYVCVYVCLCVRVYVCACVCLCMCVSV